jgi:hypothetical protein
MKYYRLLKFLVALFFLTVFIPGVKLAIPVALLISIPIFGYTPTTLFSFVMLPIIAVLYLSFSAPIASFTKADKVVTTISTLILWGFLLYFIKDFIKYSSVETLATLLPFISISVFLIYRILKLLLTSESNQKRT